MKIGIDVDDTITKTHEYVIYLKKKHLPQYDANLKLQEEVFLPFIEKYEREIHQNVQLKNGAKEALDWLKKRGHEIIILSSRGSFYNNVTEDTAYIDTKNYFIKNNLPFDQIIVNLRNKKEAAILNQIDVFIDDKINVCKEVKSAGINVIKMARFDDIKTDLKIANTWEEIISMIKEIENNKKDF